jgi:hypothetical protein
MLMHRPALKPRAAASHRSRTHRDAGRAIEASTSNIHDREQRRARLSQDPCYSCTRMHSAAIARWNSPVPSLISPPAT